MSDLELLHVFGADYSIPDGLRLVRWCYIHGANDFTIFAVVSPGDSTNALEAFDRTAAPYKKAAAIRRDMSGESRSQELWQLTEATLSAIEAAFPLGIFQYDFRADAWFEDLVLYRDGEVMLGVITHEAEGVLRLTPEEAITFRQEGFPTRREGEWVDF